MYYSKKNFEIVLSPFLRSGYFSKIGNLGNQCTKIEKGFFWAVISVFLVNSVIYVL